VQDISLADANHLHGEPVSTRLAPDKNRHPYRMSSEAAAPSECANCGADIPRGAKACPECGADERTGWRESSVYDGMDLPDAAFEDDAKPERPRNNVNGIAWYWWALGILIAIVFVAKFVI
jgi:hypothetical protein